MKKRRKSLLALFVAVSVMMTGIPVAAQEFTAETEAADQQETEEQIGEAEEIELQDEADSAAHRYMLNDISVKDEKDISNLSAPDQFVAVLNLHNNGGTVQEIDLVYEYGEEDENGYRQQKKIKAIFENSLESQEVYEIPVDLDGYMPTDQYTLKNIYIYGAGPGNQVTYTNEDGTLQGVDIDAEGSWSFPYAGELDFTIIKSEKENEIPNMLSGISVKDGNKLSNLSTSEKFNVQVNIKNVEGDEINGIKLIYDNEGHRYEYYTDEWNSEDTLKPDNNGEVSGEVEVNLKSYSGIGKYTLKSIYIYPKKGDSRYYYSSNENPKILSARDNTLRREHCFEYKGEADFTITKSEKENEISTMLSSLSVEEGNNSSEADQFIVNVGFKNVEREGIYEYDLIYECNGERKSYQYFYSSSIKPNGKGEITSELKVNLPKTDRYKKYVLKELWAFSENGDDRFYEYDATKKALSVYAENLDRYHDFKYNGEIDLKQGADAVTNLKAVSYGKNKVRVQWTKSTDADGYLVYGKRSSDGKYGYIGMTTKNSYYVDKNALDTDYNFYWVYTYKLDSDGKKIINTSCQYVYAKGGCAAVTNLKAVSQKGSVKLTWTKSADAEGYLIYGKTESGKYDYIGMTKSTSYIDKKASKSEYNFYWVFPYYKNADGKMIVGQTGKYVYGKAK